MCGINGVVRLDRQGAPVSRAEVERVRDAMAARGPDGVGLFLSPGGEVGLGHRRLAIIDLSDAGAQPMRSADGRYAIVLNGEIYNHAELRAEREASGERFRSRSDTEVLLSLYAAHGESCLPKLRGMYAFAVWDEQERRLFLARDPYGIKPLYYSSHAGVFRFASQVKALESVAALPSTVDPAGLAGFLSWGTVPEPFTLRREIRALPAGHFLEVVAGEVGRPVCHHRLGDGPRGDTADLAAALADSVRAHLVSDVPVGIFLSAGLDSTVLAALMRRERAAPPLAFTLAFQEFEGSPLDEAPGAAACASALGLAHHVRRIGRDELRELWTGSLAAMDQPSIDGFNVYLVSHFAREAGLKVVLSGVGGDELFGGYPSVRQVPAWRSLARLGRRIPGIERVWERTAGLLSARRPKAAGWLRHADTLSGAYFLRRGLFLPEEVAALMGPARAEEGLSAYDPKVDAAKALQDRDASDDWAAVHLLESTQYLRNQLLRDADWASMAHSLELRVPFVDAELQRAFASAGFEPARSGGKAAIARLAAPELPADLLQRPKSGFVVPHPDGPAPLAKTPRGLQARSLAIESLRAFGVELESLPSPAGNRMRPHAGPRRGGTLYLMSEAFRRPGGIQVYNRTQVEALRRCAPEEAVSVLVLNDRPDDVLRREWLGLAVEAHSRNKLAFSLRALRAARTQRAGRIILGHRNLLPLAPLLRLAAPASERWLLTYGIEAEPPLRRLERAWLGSIGRVFAISPATAEAFRRAGCGRSVELWPCSLPHFWELPQPSPPRFGRPVRLLSVSRLLPSDGYKGIDVSIRALALLQARGVPATLEVVGDGPDRGRLEAAARAAGVADAVSFRGRLDDAALRRCYAGCDVFLLPSAAEGFGIVYLEAMAFARPVIAASSGGAPHVVRADVNGLLVPYGDADRLAQAVGALVQDPEQARVLGERGRRLVESCFSFEELTRRTLAILGPRPPVPHGSVLEPARRGSPGPSR
jgi:asparagine synthase (glutamine-hydrolysing)